MTNVIILAAGFGSRLLPLTKDKPKSLIEFDGKTLLERNIEIFKKHGINDITIVTGYKKEKIIFKDINYIENENFEHNSTLLSLFYAIKEIKNSTIVTYSDIIFEEKILEELLMTKNDISVVVDAKWKDYWKLRTDETINDATETAIFDNEKNVTSIGHKNSQANGHFIGLMKLENNGSEKFKELFLNTKQNVINGKNKLNNELSFEKLRIVDLLEGLIKENYSIHATLTNNGWLEFDTINDFKLYRDMLDKKILKKLIRLNY
tara:strand:+ start:26087 stop:26875 length:789 start_codon:yes stop_codon:yes gene_type:complete